MNTIDDLAEELLRNRLSFMSVHIPQTPDGKWSVNFRDGPGWAIGPFEGTLRAALESAAAAFTKSRGAKRSNIMPARPAASVTDDDLADLLG